MARIWKFSSDVDTDQIVPGRYSPLMRPGEDVGKAAFIEAHPEFNRDAQPGDIIVAGENFGCGSSREYAPLALKNRQVGAIIACSFARIFYRNAVNLGVPVYIAPELVDRLQDGDEVTIHLTQDLLLHEQDTIKLPPMSEFTRKVIGLGGIIPYFRKMGHFPGEDL
jgi:methanogen homoaconitase small subunit